MSVADNIKAEEGWRAHVYPDSLGFATLGYGFLVDSRRGEGLPKDVAEYWLAYNLRKITDELTEKWPAFVLQPTEVQEALTEAAYQLGVAGLLGFKLMLAALQRGDRRAAAIEALNSDWHKQTPARAERVSARIGGSLNDR